MSAPYELHHGDMLEVMPTLTTGSVAMVFADLPYGVSGNRWDRGIDLHLFWPAIKKRLTLSGNVVATAINPFASALIQSNLKMFRYDLVWEKNSASGFLQAKTKPLRAHELILVFSGAKACYTPQMTEGVRYSHHSVTKARQTYRTSNYINKITATTTRFPRSVLRHEIARYKETSIHPTQKPVSLLQWLIATYTNPGDTVLDPCFGSATTGVACARLNRKFIGIEKDAEYFRIGKERLEAEHERLRTGPAQAALSFAV